MGPAPVIDLHCHLLPGVDDGPATLEESVAMARAAATAGTSTIVATPHIRGDYPLEPSELEPRAEALRQALHQAGVRLRVLTAGEVAISKLHDLADADLQKLRLGEGSYMLVESPYTDVGDLLETALFYLQLRGFTPLLAHPERAPAFQANPDRLAALVERGMLCSITAASMRGAFGRAVQAFARRLLESRLVHDVSSDAHDSRRRPPDLIAGFEALGGRFPSQADWYTRISPAAILAGEHPGAPPAVGTSVLRRLLRRGA